MKLIKYSYVFLLILLISCKTEKIDANTEENPVWHENLETAINEAKRENKAVLINFTGSDWCKWCKKLDNEVFVQQEFLQYAESNLVLVKIDFPRSIEQSEETKNYNRQLAQIYGVQGFPTIVLLNSNGEGIAMTGYQPGGARNYVDHLESIIEG